MLTFSEKPLSHCSNVLAVAALECLDLLGLLGEVVLLPSTGSAEDAGLLNAEGALKTTQKSAARSFLFKAYLLALCFSRPLPRQAIQECTHPDVRDRALLYYRPVQPKLCSSQFGNSAPSSRLFGNSLKPAASESKLRNKLQTVQTGSRPSVGT